MMILINLFVENIMWLDTTQLSKNLTKKLHALVLRYSCNAEIMLDILKDSLNPILEFLQKRRTVLYHEQGVENDVKYC